MQLPFTIVVLLDQDGWDAPCDVTKQTARALARQHHIVFILEFRDLRRHTVFIQKKEKNIFLVFLPEIPLLRRSPNGRQKTTAFWCTMLVWYIRIRYPYQKKYVWFFHPDALDVLMYFKTYRKLYDIVDYFTSPQKSQARMMEQKKKQLLDISDHIYVNSHTLKRMYEPYTTKPMYVVPQGFRLDVYKKKNHVFSSLFQKKQPIIGFIGGINERLDSRLLRNLITNHKEWHFVFIGVSDHDPNVSTTHFSQLYTFLHKSPHVSLLPHQPTPILASYVKQFTVCMIPYDISQPFNRYCYPMKLFEYFYMGKPVVSTPIEELKRFPSYVRIGSTVKEWEAHIHTFLEKPWPRSYAKKQRQCALKNSWDEKIRKIGLTYL